MFLSLYCTSALRALLLFLCRVHMCVCSDSAHCFVRLLHMCCPVSDANAGPSVGNQGTSLH